MSHAPPGIIDCHTHLYPPEACANPVAWSAVQREPWWRQCVAPEGRSSLQGWPDLPRLIADMDRAGIERSTLLGWYWERQETCDLHNAWSIACLREHPDRLLAYAAVQPNAGQRGRDQLERALDAGLCGIGEILPQAQAFSFDDDNWARIVEIAIARQIPINLHVSDPFAPEDLMQPTPVGHFLKLARAFPAATFILAHWGGGIPFYELNPKVQRHLKNVYYDTAASPLLYDKRVFRHVVDLIGPERILFGSDYPLMLHPRETRESGFERFLQDIAATGLTPAESNLILGANFRRLHRLRQKE